MDELSELYAACIVEFAARQPNGILAGDSAGFVKDARDAFNLPYDEALFRQAIGLLERIGVLTKYERANVPTHYSVRKSAFDNSMIVEGSGARRFESLTSTTASAAFTSSVMFGSGQRRSPTLLESYADLGSDYLTQVLEAFEPKLAQIKTPEIVKHDKMSPTQIKFGPSDIVLRPVPELIAEPIESGAWTGLPSNFMLTQEIQQAVAQIQ